MRSALPLLLAASALVADTQPKALPGGMAHAQAGSSVPAAQEGLTGKVLERLDASPYCYLRLKTAKGELWVAVPEAKAEKGAEVTVSNPMLMTQFESKTLKRTFPEVYFGTLASAGASAPSAANPHASKGQAALPVRVGKVEKARGADARTISEVWAQKGALKEKTVTVRGKVVKVSSGVMGKNWLHLQDGSGSKAKGTNDLTVTTQDGAVAVGDTVTVQGVVHTGKDFGAGYSYAVIIEDARIVKK